MTFTLIWVLSTSPKWDITFSQIHLESVDVIRLMSVSWSHDDGFYLVIQFGFANQLYDRIYIIYGDVRQFKDDLDVYT